MAQLDPTFRCSLIGTYAKEPFAFFYPNEFELYFNIGLLITDVTDITHDTAVLDCQLIQSFGGTMHISIVVDLNSGEILHKIGKKKRLLKPDRTPNNGWDDFYNQLKLTVSKPV